MLRKLFISGLLAFVLIVPGCKPQPRLGDEIQMHIGDTVSIRGEDLSVKFVNVLEDSRCPRNVVCIWEGRVRSSLQITRNNFSETLEITQPGLTSGKSETSYGEYIFTFSVSPYPEAGKTIERQDYVLNLTITR